MTEASEKPVGGEPVKVLPPGQRPGDGPTYDPAAARSAGLMWSSARHGEILPACTAVAKIWSALQHDQHDQADTAEAEAVPCRRPAISGPALGLIDEYRARVYPVLVGGGIPFFPQRERRVDLELVETRTFSSRVVYLRYRVAR